MYDVRYSKNNNPNEIIESKHIFLTVNFDIIIIALFVEVSSSSYCSFVTDNDAESIRMVDGNSCSSITIDGTDVSPWGYCSHQYSVNDTSKYSFGYLQSN